MEVTVTIRNTSNSGTLSTDDPGGGSLLVGSTSDTMDNKDNPGGGSTNDDTSLSTDISTSDTMDNKVNLNGSSTNDDPGFRGNSNTSNNQQAFSGTHESRVSLILVTRDPLDKPADEVTNTMDKDYSMLRLDEPTGEVTNTMDTDYGLVSTAGGLWWARAGHANYTILSSDMTNSFNQIAQAAILKAVTLRFGLRVHASVQGVQRGHIPGTQVHNAGLWWTGVDCAMRSYVHDCGG